MSPHLHHLPQTIAHQYKQQPIQTTSAPSGLCSPNSYTSCQSNKGLDFLDPSAASVSSSGTSSRYDYSTPVPWAKRYWPPSTSPTIFATVFTDNASATARYSNRHHCRKFHLHQDHLLNHRKLHPVRNESQLSTHNVLITLSETSQQINVPPPPPLPTDVRSQVTVYPPPPLPTDLRSQVTVSPPPPLPSNLKMEDRLETTETAKRTSSPSPAKEETSGPVVTHSLLQMVRLRSVKSSQSPAVDLDNHHNPNQNQVSIKRRLQSQSDDLWFWHHCPPM